MPHRVDPYPMSAQHRRDSYDVLTHRRPSPPPIATLNHSPSPSIPQDRSAMSTPPSRRTPPQLPSALHAPSYYTHDPGMMQSSRHHPVPPPPPPPHYPSRADSVGHHPYGFNAHPSFDHRYEHSDGSNHSSYHNTVGLPSHAAIPPVSHLPSGSHVRDAYNHPYPLPGQAAVASIYTDDANTKLSDRVRRRCFNCCTTDTSTWRRSNLSPGKVLCNKCGLFERTHSRPRPEQFPHKRGPLTGTALNNSNSSSGGSGAGGANNNNNNSGTSNSRSRTPPTNQLPPISPPYNTYSHPSIAPLNHVPDHHHHPHQQQHHHHQHQHHPHSRRDYQLNTHTPLPALQSWHPHPDSAQNTAIGPGGPPPHLVPISLPPPTPTNGHHGHHGQHGHHGHPTPPLQPLHPPSHQQPVRRDTAESLASPASTRNSRPSSPPLSLPPPSASTSTSGSASTSTSVSASVSAAGGADSTSATVPRPDSSGNDNRDSPGSAA
ncbi:hypothetical protein JOM56_007011 [Amanita muscaria]